MTSKIVRVGNTLMVEIPEELAAEASLKEGEAVEWASNGTGKLALVKEGKIPERRKRVSLEELLAGIPENAEMEKINWGPDRGAEIW